MSCEHRRSFPPTIFINQVGRRISIPAMTLCELRLPPDVIVGQSYDVEDVEDAKCDNPPCTEENCPRALIHIQKFKASRLRRN
jgi:hypothetical protein